MAYQVALLQFSLNTPSPPLRAVEGDFSFLYTIEQFLQVRLP